MGKFKAFSLIELLISLIIISVIVAAFSPVMTKKIRKGNTIISSAKNLSIMCDNPKCQICSKDKCVLCKIGTSCPDGYLNTDDCSCNACANENCLVCLENGNCKSCKAGSGGVNCEKCQKGEFSLGDSIGVCEKCPAGRYSDTIGSGTCKPCEKGFYQDQTGAQKCNPCAKGMYQDELGKTTCKKCPDGQYQSSEGQAACKTCPDNSVSNSDGLGCTCNAGYVFYHDEATNTDFCVPCLQKFPGCKLCTQDACTECQSEDLTMISNGIACGRPPKSQEDCTPYNSVYVPYVKQGTYNYSTGKHGTDFEEYGFCMTKYNAGDEGGPSIYTNKINIVPYAAYGTKMPDEYLVNTCWKPDLDKNYTKLNGCDKKEELNQAAPASFGLSSAPLVQRNSKYKEYDYSGCERTTCDKNAAWFICNAHSIGNTKQGYWTLPTDGQLSNLSSIFAIETKTKPIVNNFMGGDGLQLCAENREQICSRHGSGYTAWTDVGHSEPTELKGTIACIHNYIDCTMSIYYNYPTYKANESYYFLNGNTWRYHYLSKPSLITYNPSYGELHFYDNPDGSKRVVASNSCAFSNKNLFAVNSIEHDYECRLEYGSSLMSNVIASSVRCVLNYVLEK